MSENNPAASCNSSVKVPKRNSSETDKRNLFTCDSCKKVYGTRAGLYKHNRAYHPNRTMKSIACSEPDCKCVFKALQQYQQHLRDFHNVQIKTFTKTFKDQKGIAYTT